MEEDQCIETNLNIFRDGHYIPEESFGIIIRIVSPGESYYVEFPRIKYNPTILCYQHELSKVINN